jgi:hypothetical protein
MAKSREPQHPYTALRAYERCLAAMLADPAVTGDLLLIGLWLARVRHLDDPPKGHTKYSDAARTVFGTPDVDRVYAALRTDLPKLDPHSQRWGTDSGGALARHLPGPGWNRLWAKLSSVGSPADTSAMPVARPRLTIARDRT